MKYIAESKSFMLDELMLLKALYKFVIRRDQRRMARRMRFLNKQLNKK